MSHLSLLGLTVSTRSSPASSRSSKSTTSESGSDSDGPAAYHTNLMNLLPTLQLPPPLRGMSRMRAVAQRQCVGSLDVLGILAKVVMRPHPVINLGPIDHTASCVIVDLDLPDRPLVWASESFCQMSGYALEDILGRNPRFMQAPGGHVLSRPQMTLRSPQPRSPQPKSPGQVQPEDRPGPSTTGESKDPDSDETIRPSPAPTPTPAHPQPPTPPSHPSSTTPTQTSASETRAYIPPPNSHVPAGSERIHTSKTTVAHIKAKLDAHEEVQATILNYRKDGTPFWNWLSVVPVREAGEGSRFRYHVGIMVDLVQQPRAIIQTMQAGFYIRAQS
ncbi:blue light receptor [Ceratobasidium sp. 395]|nr:blue light receptor [Ceratobasidium sp. 395]